MEMSDKQRRWWFANHPEYSDNPKGSRGGRDSDGKPESRKIDPKQVDEYVDNALKYQTGFIAELLKSTKRHFGTEGQRPRQSGREKGRERLPNYRKRLKKYPGIIEEEPGLEEDWGLYTWLFPGGPVYKVGRGIGTLASGGIKAARTSFRGFLKSLTRHTVTSATKNKVKSVTIRTRRWRVGDDPLMPTRTRKIPSWSAQAARIWKNEGAKEGAEKAWKSEYLERMRKGLPPRRRNPNTGEWESMELHHHPIPKRDGGTEVVMVWPEEHAKMDPFRRLKKGK